VAQRQGEKKTIQTNLRPPKPDCSPPHNTAREKRKAKKKKNTKKNTKQKKEGHVPLGPEKALGEGTGKKAMEKEP